MGRVQNFFTLVVTTSYQDLEPCLSFTIENSEHPKFVLILKMSQGTPAGWIVENQDQIKAPSHLLSIFRTQFYCNFDIFFLGALPQSLTRSLNMTTKTKMKMKMMKMKILMTLNDLLQNDKKSAMWRT